MRITGTYDRSGDCDVCGKRVTRTKSFKGATMAELEAQAAAWGETTLRHPKCERQA